MNKKLPSGDCRPNVINLSGIDPFKKTLLIVLILISAQ